TQSDIPRPRERYRSRSPGYRGGGGGGRGYGAHHQPTTITTIVAAHRVATAPVVTTTVVAPLLRVAITMTRVRIATVHRVAALLRKTTHHHLAVATRLMTATPPRRHRVATPSRSRILTGTSGSSSTDVLQARGEIAGVTIAATARLT
ncbi:hypothetical protein LTR33_018668, partial [Friedmanniomyces endolithicus]